MVPESVVDSLVVQMCQSEPKNQRVRLSGAALSAETFVRSVFPEGMVGKVPPPAHDHLIQCGAAESAFCGDSTAESAVRSVEN